MDNNLNLSAVEEVQYQWKLPAQLQFFPQTAQPQVHGLWPHGHWPVWQKFKLVGSGVIIAGIFAQLNKQAEVRPGRNQCVLLLAHPKKEAQPLF